MLRREYSCGDGGLPVWGVEALARDAFEREDQGTLNVPVRFFFNITPGLIKTMRCVERRILEARS